MATAQQMLAGPRSAQLADDAATAALYATHPRRKASVRDAAPAEPQYLNQRGTGGASNLSAASAGAALAHANRKPVEIWQPGRLTEAEKAAFYAKDYALPEIPRPSTQYSAEGLGAAILAVRAQRGTSMVSPTPDTSVEQMQDRALRAATGAYTTRQRADSAPTEPVVSTDSPWARSAAGASRRVRVEEEGPLDHLDSAMEASRIQHIANTNARLYTSSPPVASEVEERNRRNSMHAAAISMAKDMYDITGSRGEAGDRSSAVYAAQRGQDRNRARKTVSMGDGTAGQRALTLQDAAQKRAAEKLARMQDEHAELQQYYGTAPEPPRSRLSIPGRRKRTSSEADATRADAERSRHIRNQMFTLRTELNRVDEKRQQDRDLLMEAARRNVDATIHDIEMKMYADTGRAPPSIQKQWDEAAQARARQEAEAAEATGARRDHVNIGAQQYIDMADVEAVARTRVQPALDEIEDQAERRRAEELEARLDAEEQQRQAAIEKEREADRRAVEKQQREKVPEKREKREPKGLNLLLRRWKSKRVPAEKPEPEREEAAAPAPQDRIREARATGSIAPPIEATHQMAPEDSEAQKKPVTQEAAAPASQERIREARAVGAIVPPAEATHQMAPEDTERQEKPVTREAAAPASQERIREARAVGTIAPPAEATHPMAPEDSEAQKPVTREAAAPAPQERIREARAIETIAPPLDATRQVAPEDAETPGASTVFAAAPAPIGAPVRLVRGPSEPAGTEMQPGMARPDTVQRDAAATGVTVSATHTIKPITSPRANSKLKTWFRDRLARRSSGPIPVYPNQPGPDYNTESEVGFTGGAALTGRSEPRGAALSSHPVTGSDLEADTAGYDGKNGDVAQTNTEETTQAYGNGDKNGDSKRSRFRRSFMKTVSWGSPEGNTNGITHARKSSEALPESSEETGTDLQSLRNSAAEQGLPVPPVLKETVNAGRESRFSEDL